MKTHWRPSVPISYPSGPGRIRTFMLRNSVACGREDCSDWSITRKWVTCKQCLRIASTSRRDTDSTIEKVLRCDDPLAADPSGGVGR